MSRKTILFAADFSKRDREAFHHACNFASAWKARLLILHVDDSPSLDSKTEATLSSNPEIFDLLPEDIEIDYEYVVKRGDPAEVILEVENDKNVDLVVLGTHARKGLDRLFSGSVAEKVIRKSHCPVLTWRDHQVLNSSNATKTKTKVLVPIDFSVHSYAALDFASSIAHALHAAITILHVDHSADNSIKQFPDRQPAWTEHQNSLWDQIRKYKPTGPRIEYGHKILRGSAAEEIPNYANTENYDYVVLGTHGRSGIGRLLMGSVAENVVRNADCPVISVKPSNKRNPVLTEH